MKKIVSLVLALSMVMSMFVSAFAATKTFEDVTEPACVGAVEALVELGVIDGLPDGTYGPEKNVTRAQLAKMLVICLGLGNTADSLKGKPAFDDVADSHWATGYINAAVQSKVIAGYPDGTFKPEKNVSYAEAITMVIRALGYGNVVDTEGVWPTSYMLKAVELELLDDMGNPKSNEAATRGNVAILLWNMLRTPMWKIVEESQGNGMTSSDAKGDKMLEVKFPKYSYDTAEFTGYEITEGKEAAEVRMSFGEDVDYAYEGLDFYTFVPGTIVEILVNDEDDMLLSIVPTDDNKLVEGDKDTIDDDYEALKEVAYDYAYVLAERKTVIDAAVLSGDSIVVDKLEVKDNYVRVNGEKCDNDEWDYELIIKDGERASLRDLEVGDVLTEVFVTYENETPDSFFVIGSETAEGELTRYAEVSYKNSELTFEQMTVSKEKYVVAEGATYVEDPEAKTIKSKELAGSTQADEMEGEEVELILDAMFGKVVRVNFDGKIDSGNAEETTIGFYGITADVDKDGRTYNIVLENETGSETYDFARNSDAEAEAKEAYANGTDRTGSFAWAELNDEGDIVKLVVIADYSGDVLVLDNVVYGEEAEDEYYAIVSGDAAEYDDEKNAIVSGDEVIVKVNDNTVLVSLVFDDKGTTKETDDEYRVEFSTDLTAVKGEKVLVIYDAASSFTRAKYVVEWSDTSDKSGNQVAKVVSPDENEIYVGGQLIDLEDADGEEITATIAEGTKDISAFELVVYTLTTNSRGKEIFNFIAGLHTGELKASNENHGYVGETNGDRVFLLGETEVDIDSEEYEDYRDFMIVVVDVTESEDDVDQYEVNGFEVVDFEEGSLEEGDRISIRAEEEIIFIIKGMPVRDAE